ncbi:MAG: DUF3656 domain-containing protein [Carboxydocellales bacterium]
MSKEIDVAKITEDIKTTAKTECSPGFRPELLAPVGGWEALLAAMANGADAIYLGGKQFSARQSADNFDREELLRAVEHVHLRGGRLYVTVNTLLADGELEAGLDYLRFLYETGVDAVILQDLGLARLVRRALPELELHASTQMTVHNLPGVELMKDLGFERVVLSREVSLENIKHIRANSEMELETFIHGALCVCYSGECLMSSLIGGRSGNRGRCAQPCRMEYTLVDAQGKAMGAEGLGNHLLSPRDLNTIEQLPKLIQAGICSFKVEGRMKRPEYVATVIRVYREAIDRYLADPEHFNVSEEDKRDLRQIFNRDFTTGYYFGNPGLDLMSYKRPNNRGLKLGRVTGYNPSDKTAELLLEDELQLGDGLEIWVTQGGRQGITVQRITLQGQVVEKAAAGQKVEVEVPGRTGIGDRIFKTFDANLMARARQSFEAPKYGRKIPLQVKVEVRAGEPLRIILKDDQGNCAQGETAFLAEAALKRPLTEETIHKQVDRLGNTPFAIKSLTVDIAGELMVPVSEINEARRQAVDLLEAMRLKANHREPIKDWNKRFKQAFTRHKGNSDQDSLGSGQVLSVSVAQLSCLKAAVDNGANRVYFGGESFRQHKPVTAGEIEAGIAYCHQKGVQFVLATPRILQDDELAAYWPKVREVLGKNINGILVANLGVAKLLAKETGAPPLLADFPLNAFNQQSIACIGEQGFSQVTLSPELTLDQVEVMGEGQTFLDMECLVHGMIPMMVSEYCAVGCTLGGKKAGENCQIPCRNKGFGLKDRMNFVFPLAMDEFCHLHVFNAKELCVVEELGLLKAAGIRSFRLELKLREARDVGQITRIYREELDRLTNQKGRWKPSAEAKEQLFALSPAGITKGHYFRGVL